MIFYGRWSELLSPSVASLLRLSRLGAKLHPPWDVCWICISAFYSPTSKWNIAPPPRHSKSVLIWLHSKNFQLIIGEEREQIYWNMRWLYAVGNCSVVQNCAHLPNKMKSSPRGRETESVLLIVDRTLASLSTSLFFGPFALRRCHFAFSLELFKTVSAANRGQRTRAESMRERCKLSGAFYLLLFSDSNLNVSRL